MAYSLSMHKRARPAPLTPGHTVPCTPPLSTQHKRARRLAQPQPPPTSHTVAVEPVPVPDWSSLPPDLVRRVDDRVVAADDIDYYMDFRAVCHSWRHALKDNNNAAKPTDDLTCFQPTKWGVLDRAHDNDDVDVLMLVNLETGRFRRRRIPLLLRDHLFVGAANGGLVLLAESACPCRARVLNPFTGAMACFNAPVPVGEVREIAVIAASPTTTTVFVSMVDDGAVMWADQDSKYFRKCVAPPVPYYGYPNDGVLSMVPFAGDVYLTNRQGSVLSIPASAVSESQTISMATVIPEALLGSHCHYYLVESGGELLLVTRPAWCGVTGDQVTIERVDTVRNVLEPVSSIGRRALFLSRVRCVSVDADKFPAVQGGRIYFVDQFVTGSCYFDVQLSFMTVVRFPYADTDGVKQQQPMVVDVSPLPADCFRPFTLTHVFAKYCKFVQCSELRRQIMNDGEGDFSDEDSDDDEDYFSSDDDDDGSDYDGGSSETFIGE